MKTMATKTVNDVSLNYKKTKNAAKINDYYFDCYF